MVPKPQKIITGMSISFQKALNSWVSFDLLNVFVAIDEPDKPIQIHAIAFCVNNWVAIRCIENYPHFLELFKVEHRRADKHLTIQNIPGHLPQNINLTHSYNIKNIPDDRPIYVNGVSILTYITTTKKSFFI